MDDKDIRKPLFVCELCCTGGGTGSENEVIYLS